MNLTKSKNRRYLFAFVIATVLISVLFFKSFRSEEPLTVSEPLWECVWEKDICICHIDFEIKNNTPENYIIKFIIRSQEKKPAVRSTLIEILGQHQYDLEIDAYKILKFGETFKYKSQPSSMVVTIVSKNPI